MKWIELGLKLYPLVVGAIHAVERIAGSKKGKDKQDAAVDAVGAMIAAIEIAAGNELLNEAEFQKLLRKLIDAYVAVQNFIAEWNKNQAKPTS